LTFLEWRQTHETQNLVFDRTDDENDFDNDGDVFDNDDILQRMDVKNSLPTMQCNSWCTYS